MEVTQGGGGCSPTRGSLAMTRGARRRREPVNGRSAAAPPRGIEPRPPASILAGGAQLTGRIRLARSARGPSSTADHYKKSALTSFLIALSSGSRNQRVGDGVSRTGAAGGLEIGTAVLTCRRVGVAIGPAGQKGPRRTLGIFSRRVRSPTYPVEPRIDNHVFLRLERGFGSAPSGLQ